MSPGKNLMPPFHGITLHLRRREEISTNIISCLPNTLANFSKCPISYAFCFHKGTLVAFPAFFQVRNLQPQERGIFCTMKSPRTCKKADKVLYMKIKNCLVKKRKKRQQLFWTKMPTNFWDLVPNPLHMGK